MNKDPGAKQLTGPWDDICAEGVRSDTLVSLLSAELDPVVLDYIDFFHQPQNLKGFNLGYAFANFRSKGLADRFIELLNEFGFPSNSRKSLELLLSQAKPVYKAMDVDEEKSRDGTLSKRKRLRLATRFWFDHEPFPATCSVDSTTAGMTGAPFSGNKGLYPDSLTSGANNQPKSTTSSGSQLVAPAEGDASRSSAAQQPAVETTSTTAK